MVHKIKLKNDEAYVYFDDNVYKYIQGHPYYNEINLMQNLRKHSSGCAVFQKTLKNDAGGFRTMTLYLHRMIAEKFIPKINSSEKQVVGAKNGDKLDCRLANLEWRSRSVSSRHRRTTSKTGYTGVYQENKKYRAIITIEGKAVHLGMYQSAEEAAEAFNSKAQEIYGVQAKLNTF
ncbi:MAG: HNH endonuclease [Saprospiraceae bacterium]